MHSTEAPFPEYKTHGTFGFACSWQREFLVSFLAEMPGRKEGRKKALRLAVVAPFESFADFSSVSPFHFTSACP